MANVSLGQECSDSLALGQSPFAARQGVAFVLAGAAGLVGAVFLMDNEASPVGIALAAVGVLLLTYMFGSMIWRGTRKQYVQFFEDGLTTTVKGITGSIAYKDVQGIRFMRKERYANGEYSGFDFELALWDKRRFDGKPTAAAKGVIAEKSAAHAQFGEALSPALDSILENMEARLHSGEQIAGDGFQLDRTSLKIGHDRIQLDDIAMVGLFDHKVCIWKSGEESPCIRLEQNATNVYPVLAILEKRIEEKGTATEIPGLGRLLFEKKAKRIGTWILAIITALSGLGILGCLALAIKESDFVFVAILPLLSALIFGLACLNTIRSYFRCYQQGVAQQGLLSRKELMYEEIDSFTYSATRNYYNGAYVGTAIVMTFLPDKKARKKAIKYSCSVYNQSDSDVDELRDHIARVVARKLIDRVNAGETVYMGADQLRINLDGVSYNESKLFGKGDEIHLSWDEVEGAALHEGHFHLFKTGEEKSVFTIPAATANFFPLFFVFLMLKYPDDEEQQNAATKEAAREG